MHSCCCSGRCWPVLAWDLGLHLGGIYRHVAGAQHHATPHVQAAQRKCSCTCSIQSTGGGGQQHGVRQASTLGGMGGCCDTGWACCWLGVLRDSKQARRGPLGLQARDRLLCRRWTHLSCSNPQREPVPSLQEWGPGQGQRRQHRRRQRHPRQALCQGRPCQLQAQQQAHRHQRPQHPGLPCSAACISSMHIEVCFKSVQPLV
jgi:hypothetical protein